MADLTAVFGDLRRLMAPYGEQLDVKRDSDTELYIDTWHVQKNRKPLFFGAVQLKKSYVSYHLMPVYISPDLLQGVSPELRACMQGKSCFNFKDVEPGLLEELAHLTEQAFASYRTSGYV